MSKWPKISKVVGQVVPMFEIGGVFYGNCPFHKDVDFSLSANDIKGIYKCEVCKRCGDVIKFVQDYENIEFGQACKKIFKNYDIEKNLKEESIMYNHQSYEFSYKTQIEKLDDIIYGVESKNLLLISGTEDKSRRDLLLTVCLNISKSESHPFLLLSKLPKDTLMERLMEIETGILLRREVPVTLKTLKDSQIAIDKLSNLNLEIKDLKYDEDIVEVIKKHGSKVVFIDDVISLSSDKIIDLSKLCKQLNMAIIISSRVEIEGDDEAVSLPRISDLDSKHTNHIDQIIFVHPDSKDKEMIIVAKNKSFELGKFRIHRFLD